MNSKTTNPLMKQNLKEESMEMIIGVILPIVLIVIANKLQGDYKSRQEEKRYRDQISRFTADVLKEVKAALPKGE